MSGSASQYQDLINNAASTYGVPPALLTWQLGQESGFNPLQVTGQAEGIAQIKPDTAADPGYNVQPISDPFDPAQAIPFAAAYDAALYNNTGSWSAALTKYGTLANVPASVTDSFDQVLQQNGIPNSLNGSAQLSGNAADSYAPLYPGGNYGGANPAATVNPTPYYSAPGGIAAPGVGAGGASGIPGYGVPATASGGGWISLVEELAIRVMLVLVGIVLIGAGFYVAGQRTGGLASRVGVA
jgi:hypothetical protein